MISWIERAKPIKVEFNGVEIIIIHVSKSGSRIDKSGFLRVTTVHLVIIHLYASKANLKISIWLKHWNPFGLLFCIRISYVTRQIVASKLEIATIFAQAHRKLSFLYNVLLLHNIVDRLKFVQILSGALRA